jgi:hypothetical protein
VSRRPGRLGLRRKASPASGASVGRAPWANRWPLHLGEQAAAAAAAREGEGGGGSRGRTRRREQGRRGRQGGPCIASLSLSSLFISQVTKPLQFHGLGNMTKS